MKIFSPTISGSTNISGSVIISGSLNLSSDTNLVGTASYAITASYAMNGGGGGTGNGFPFSGSAVITGSLYVSGGAITGSLEGTASYATTSSFAITASYALNAGTTVNTGSFVTTSSFNSFTSSVVTTSSFNSFTSSVVTTSSFNSFTSSVVTTSSFNNFTSSYNTGSFSGSLVGTASWANTASYLINTPGIDTVLAQTQSLTTNRNINLGYGNTLTFGNNTYLDGLFKIDTLDDAVVIGDVLSYVSGTYIELSNLDRTVYLKAHNGFFINVSGSGNKPIVLSVNGTGSTQFDSNITLTTIPTASFALTASYALNAGTTINTSSLVTTSSFNSFTASYNTGSFTGSFTGSLQGTASWANNVTSASYALSSTSASYSLNSTSASYAQTSSFILIAQTASYVLNAISSSFSTTASSADAFIIRGNLIVSGSTTIGDATTDSITFNAATMSLGNGSGILNIDSNTLYVDGNNNRVGIGTSSPASKLQVSGTTTVNGPWDGNTTNGLHLAFTSNTGSIYSIQNGTAYRELQIEGSPIALNFNSTNNVGIGFRTPSYKLDVNGDGRFTNGLTVTGSLTVITGSSIEFQVTNNGTKIGTAITDTHTVTGSLNLSGSTTIIGTLTATTIVAQTITSSTEWVTGSSKFGNIITDTHQFTGSVSISGSLNATASWANNATSASYALNSTSASYAVTTSYAQTLAIQSTLTTFTSSTTSAGVNTLFTQATSSYNSAFGKYTILSGSNARAGEFMTVWNSGSITYTDVATTDIGSTSDVVFSSSFSGANILLQASASAGWTIKMLTTYI